MRHLIIKNVGPLKEVDIELKQINVIIGPQSSGKSCVLKIACYCTWVEKRIEIEQDYKRFQKKGQFEEELSRFHKLDGFIRSDSYIKYESDLMCFSYAGAAKKFTFKWKDGRWNYKRTKICYIPAERNMVAVIPNWFEVSLSDNNIRNFMSDWENARKAIGDMLILNLGVKYHYEPSLKADKVQLNNGLTLDFTNASSGLQSVIPLCVLLQYFLVKQFGDKAPESVKIKAEKEKIARCIYKELFKEKSQNEQEVTQRIEGSGINIRVMSTVSHIDNQWFVFRDKKDTNEYKKYYRNYTKVDHCDIFLEEPEENLFPSTQYDLLNWMIAQINGERKHSLFIATHSPYIMTSLNNLLEAGNVIAKSKGKRMEVEKIVPKNGILTTEDIGAYSLEDGVVSSMIDTESNLISAEKLDEASDVISEKFDKLLLL